jgi:hypothetical protein|tara:strand:+ start:69 stop:827 length:759 start_codon:yes stop_codon:yes gene_type:complete
MKLTGFNDVDFSKHELGYELISKTELIIFRKRRYRNRKTGEWQYCSEITGKPYLARERYKLSECSICDKEFFAPDRYGFISCVSSKNSQEKIKKENKKEIFTGSRGGKYYKNDKVCSTECKNLHASKNKANKYTFENPTVNSAEYPSFYPDIDDPFAVRTKDGKTKMIACHRYIMSKELNRPLEPWEHIHHIDMTRTNYDISNLYLCTDSEHQAVHDSFNRCCKDLMIYGGKIKFDTEVGKYYLIKKENNNE